ncbi:Uncharacterised protein [Burkholderia pseudomallei]|nr:Uncharacterised protein [Burkholderia pseudomallei]
MRALGGLRRAGPRTRRQRTRDRALGRPVGAAVRHDDVRRVRRERPVERVDARRRVHRREREGSLEMRRDLGLAPHAAVAPQRPRDRQHARAALAAHLRAQAGKRVEKRVGGAVIRLAEVAGHPDDRRKRHEKIEVDVLRGGIQRGRAGHLRPQHRVELGARLAHQQRVARDAGRVNHARQAAVLAQQIADERRDGRRVADIDGPVANIDAGGPRDRAERRRQRRVRRRRAAGEHDRRPAHVSRDVLREREPQPARAPRDQVDARLLPRARRFVATCRQRLEDERLAARAPVAHEVRIVAAILQRARRRVGGLRRALERQQLHRPRRMLEARAAHERRQRGERALGPVRRHQHLHRRARRRAAKRELAKQLEQLPRAVREPAFERRRIGIDRDDRRVRQARPQRREIAPQRRAFVETAEHQPVRDIGRAGARALAGKRPRGPPRPEQPRRRDIAAGRLAQRPERERAKARPDAAAVVADIEIDGRERRPGAVAPTRPDPRARRARPGADEAIERERHAGGRRAERVAADRGRHRSLHRRVEQAGRQPVALARVRDAIGQHDVREHFRRAACAAAPAQAAQAPMRGPVAEAHPLERAMTVVRVALVRAGLAVEPRAQGVQIERRLGRPGHVEHGAARMHALAAARRIGRRVRFVRVGAGPGRDAPQPHAEHALGRRDIDGMGPREVAEFDRGRVRARERRPCGMRQFEVDDARQDLPPTQAMVGEETRVAVEPHAERRAGGVARFGLEPRRGAVGVVGRGRRRGGGGRLARLGGPRRDPVALARERIARQRHARGPRVVQRAPVRDPHAVRPVARELRELPLAQPCGHDLLHVGILIDEIRDGRLRRAAADERAGLRGARRERAQAPHRFLERRGDEREPPRHRLAALQRMRDGGGGRRVIARL